MILFIKLSPAALGHTSYKKIFIALIAGMRLHIDFQQKYKIPPKVQKVQYLKYYSIFNSSARIRLNLMLSQLTLYIKIFKCKLAIKEVNLSCVINFIQMRAFEILITVVIGN